MYSVILMTALATQPDAVDFHRRGGCQGQQANAGCTSTQAGCQGRAGCGGLFGGNRFIHRERHRSVTKGYHSAPIVAPANAPKPMPKAMNCPTGICPTVQTAIFPTTDDALAQVNEIRGRRGLRPFLQDLGLTLAARRAAEFRAARFIPGHVDDFRFLPDGVTASAAGCAALEPSWGFQSCCLNEDWTYAGAATVQGADGRLYHHLFVR